MDSWTFAFVLLAVALVILVISLLSLYFAEPSSPRVTMRDLPKLTQSVPEVASITVAGREYEVLAQNAASRVLEACTWCLRPIALGDEIVRCKNRHCQGVSHRQHAEEFGGCGGVCGVLR